MGIWELSFRNEKISSMVGNSYGIYIMLFFYYWPFYLPILVKRAKEERKREKEKGKGKGKAKLEVIFDFD